MTVGSEADLLTSLKEPNQFFYGKTGTPVHHIVKLCQGLYNFPSYCDVKEELSRGIPRLSIQTKDKNIRKLIRIYICIRCS